MDVDYNMFTVGADRVPPFTATLKIEVAPLEMEVDTGEALSLISAATFAQLWPAGTAPQLTKSSIRLRTYTGEELQLVGEGVVRVQYQNQQEDLNLVCERQWSELAWSRLAAQDTTGLGRDSFNDCCEHRIGENRHTS